MPHKPVGNGVMVYLHNSVFYVGNDRPWVKKGRNKWWKNIVAKHGYIVEILFHSLTDDIAKQCEIDLIALFNPPCNLTAGGDGASYIGEEGDILKKAIGQRMRITVQSDKWKNNHALAMKAKFDNPETAQAHTKRMKEITSSKKWRDAMIAGCAKRGDSWKQSIKDAQSSPEKRKLKAEANKTMKVVISYADRWNRPYTTLVGYPYG